MVERNRRASKPCTRSLTKGKATAAASANPRKVTAQADLGARDPSAKPQSRRSTSASTAGPKR